MPFDINPFDLVAIVIALEIAFLAPFIFLE